MHLPAAGCGSSRWLELLPGPGHSIPCACGATPQMQWCFVPVACFEHVSGMIAQEGLPRLMGLP